MLLNFETADVHELIRRAIQTCCPDRPPGDVTFSPDARRHHVRGDPTRLQQIFWNLLSNADKFTPPGRPITVRSSDTGVGGLRVEVSDRGVGIDPTILPGIFDAFSQGDASLTRQFGGLGLGLTITKALVEAHGGTIGVTSPGRGLGATFVVELPTVASPAARRMPAVAGPSLSSSRTALRILLVEDHEGTLEVMTRLLEHLGHHVKTAATVKAALEIAEREEIDLVVSDLALPDGTGHDVMRCLKSRCAVKGIAVSGFGMDEDIRKSLEAGFVKHLTKPIDLEKLDVAIRQASD
jgi:CheY-like chemotaxis protein